MSNPWKRKEIIGDCTLYLGDCMEVMPTLGKVDAVVTDPPYGTTQNIWDFVVPLKDMWSVMSAKSYIFTAAEPYMSALVQSRLDIFKYDLVWMKSQAVGHLNAKKMPMRNHENIAVFGHGKITYNPQLKNKPKENIRPVGKRAASDNYGKFGEYADRGIPLDKRYPQSVEMFENVNVGEKVKHPTQKPLKLFCELISTYSNVSETILDPFMGSGTTPVACAKLGRSGIGIELDPDYFDIACERVEKAYSQADLFVAPPENKDIKRNQTNMFDDEDAA